MIGKPDSKLLPLVTASILGQAPSANTPYTLDAGTWQRAKKRRILAL